MRDNYNINDFTYKKITNIDFDLEELIKDDYELKKFIGIGDNNTKVIFYKNTPIGFKYESSYMGLPELQCAIFKDFRGMGIGTFLLNDFKNKKFNENYRALALLIDRNNVHSIESAKKAGFKLDDTYEEFNPDNSNTPYYVFYLNNPNYVNEKKR